MKKKNDEDSSERDKLLQIDVDNSRFPYAIVWTPILPITTFLPFIGHMGIADSEGIIFDFAGPYYIGKDDMAFGKPTRYLVLDPSKVRKGTWDEGVGRGCQDYSKRMHNLICDNCHSHVAQCLMHMEYNNFTKWNMVILCFWMFFQGKFVSVGRTVYSYLPFTIFLGFLLVFYYVSKR